MQFRKTSELWRSRARGLWVRGVSAAAAIGSDRSGSSVASCTAGSIESSGLVRSSPDHFAQNSSFRLLTRMSVRHPVETGSRESGGSDVRPQTDWRKEAGGGHAFAFATQISRSWSPRICPAPRRLPRGPWRGRPECWQPPGRSLSPGVLLRRRRAVRQVHRIPLSRQRTTPRGGPIPKTGVGAIHRSQFGSWRIALHAQRILTGCHQLPAGAGGSGTQFPRILAGPSCPIIESAFFGRLTAKLTGTDCPTARPGYSGAAARNAGSQGPLASRPRSARPPSLRSRR